MISYKYNRVIGHYHGELHVVKVFLQSQHEEYKPYSYIQNGRAGGEGGRRVITDQRCTSWHISADGSDQIETADPVGRRGYRVRAGREDNVRHSQQFPCTQGSKRRSYRNR